MTKAKNLDRRVLWLGAALLLAAPGVTFALARQGVEPGWLPGAIAAVMAMLAVTLMVRPLLRRPDNRA